MTEGSVENLKLLNDPRSGVQIAFMQEGITDARQAPDLLSLGRITKCCGCFIRRMRRSAI